MEENHQLEAEVSKTQLKKTAHELQELGEKLTKLKEHELALLPIDERLNDAIIEFQMRKYDKEELEKALVNLDKTPTNTLSSKESSNNFLNHLSELSQSILDSGDYEINKLVSDYPVLERQKLRQLYRDHKKAEAGTQAGIKQKIYNYLRQSITD